MSRESSVVREPLRPDLPPVWLASPPGSAATFVRSEESLDQPENVVPPRSRSMALRSHSRAGRSKSLVPTLENLLGQPSRNPKPYHRKWKTRHPQDGLGEKFLTVPISTVVEKPEKLHLDPFYRTVQDRKWKVPPVRPFHRCLPIPHHSK